MSNDAFDELSNDFILLFRLALVALSSSLAFACAPAFMDTVSISRYLCYIDVDANSTVFLLITREGLDPRVHIEY